MIGLLLGGLVFGSCNRIPGITGKDRNIRTLEEDVVNVRIVKPDQAERDEALVNSFLRCADIAVFHVRHYHDKNKTKEYNFLNGYNFLDEAYFRSQEPVFFVHERHTKTDYEYKKVRQYDPAGAGYDIWKPSAIKRSYYTEKFIPKSEFRIGSESHGRVSYEELLRNYFTGDYYGMPYVCSEENNKKATQFVYKIFQKIYRIDDFANANYDINPSFGYETIWKQDSKGRITYIPLNEIRDANPSYKQEQNTPIVDLTKFDNYFKRLSWKEKEPIKHYYLYTKYEEMNMHRGDKYRALH